MEYFIFLCLTVKGALGLRLTRIEVPSAAVRGESVWLNCSFDLESDELYSIKWYKNSVEFYRFMPFYNPSKHKYNFKGVYVDLEKSNFGHVLLYRTDLGTEGTYKCEVSAEAPSFQTVSGEKELKVYVLPEEGPSISGIKPQYHIGDEVNVTCMAGPSKPAATLKWYINGKEAPSKYETKARVMKYPDKLQISKLGLRFVVQPAHYYLSTMRLRCTAVISHAYSMSNEEIIVADNIKTSGYHSGLIGDGPSITGGKPKYQVGDVVDVNCTSAKSKPAAELLWYINDLKAMPEFIIRYPNIKHPDDFEATVLGLRFPVKRSHFENEEMRLKCTATLSKVINMSSEETFIGSSQQSSGIHISEKLGTVINDADCTSTLLSITTIGVMISIWT